MRTLTGILLAGTAALALAGSAHAQSANLIDPGTIGGYTGSANIFSIDDTISTVQSSFSNYAAGLGVSGDGSTLIGVSGTSSGYGHAFVWTAGGGFTDLGSLAGANGRSVALGTNADGTVVVGESDNGHGVWHAIRWTAAGGMVDLGTISGTGDSIYSGATAVSADGLVVTGASHTETTNDHIFRWTQSGGMQDLGTLQGSAGFAAGFGINADGSVIVGYSSTASGASHAVRWTQSGGLVDLGTIVNAPGNSIAMGTNADGSVAVGRSIDATGAFNHAFRWTQAGGMADLGTIGNTAGSSAAFAVDADGGVVVGTSAATGGNHAFVWTAATGMQGLNDILSNAGVNMAGVTLVGARGVSSNGQFIAGDGTFPGAPGATHAFIARIGAAAGVTDFSSVQASIAALADSRTSQMINNALLAGVLLGGNEQVSCSNCGGMDVSFGSFNVGAHGRYNLTPEWTLIGGVSLGKYKEGGADVSLSATMAGAVRFDPDDMGASRPYAEAGLTLSPSQTTTYRRTYANGSGTATGIGKTRSTDLSVYGRLGWVDRVSRLTEVAADVHLSHGWQYVADYDEPASTSNPFNASVSGGADQMTVTGIGAQVTHLFGGRVEADLNAAFQYAFDMQSGLNAAIAGVGNVTAARSSLTWVDVGGRIGYRLGGGWTLDAFANSALGPRAVGHSIHWGIGIRTEF